VPATNYTPIQFYRSTTSGNQPSAANLSPGELALNIADTDMTMYFENASGVVKRFFNNPAELKYPTADGTLNQGIKTDGSKTLSFGDLASAAITNNTRQAVTSSATTTIDLSSGQVIDLTMAANITTLSFTNVPASGTPVLVQIVVRNASSGTAYTIAWPNSVYWSGQYTGTTISNVQTAPTLASGANGVTTIALLTTDGGIKWRGWVEGTIPGGSLNSLYSWGNNFFGQLGLNDVARRSSPTQVGALTDWASVSAKNYFCVAVKTDGTLWSWGRGNNGRLGQNSNVYTSSPVQVGALTNWASVSAGSSFCAAIKTDGTLWTWGLGAYGRLGQNGTTTTSSPVQVGALTNWASVSAGYDSCAATKTDGTLWSWGRGINGQLGLNNTTQYNSPKQVGALTNWASVSAGSSFCAAIKTDGTLWSWGYGGSGRLGQNGTTTTSSPVQVGALTNWSSVSSYFMCAAVKTDGTLWSWGSNGSGELGQNNAGDKSSPIQIGSLTDWASASASAGQNACAAIKTNGTLWTWGAGADGRLGQNNTTYRSSPVQVGALTNWSKVSAGSNFCLATTALNISPA
jgi:alpha-tubulin suppressor-like RCC1 family protein